MDDWTTQRGDGGASPAARTLRCPRGMRPDVAAHLLDIVGALAAWTAAWIA
jgi:hypothetical protein